MVENKSATFDKEDREVIIEYRKAEIERLDSAVYEPLLKKCSTIGMRTAIEEDKRTIDLLANLEAANSLSGSLSMLVKDSGKALNGLDSLVDDVSDLLKELPVGNILGNMLSQAKDVAYKINNMDVLIQCMVSVKRQHYSDLADAIRNVSSEKKVPVSEVVRDTRYLFEAYRQVTPTREWAEKYINITAKGVEVLTESTDVLTGFTKMFGAVASPVFGFNKFPISEKKILLDSLKEYKLKELDAIYAK